MNISINKNILNKGNPTAHGWINADLTVEQLATHIKAGCSFSPGVLKSGVGDKKPTSNDVDYAELLVLDIDNDTIGIDGKKRKKNENEKYLDFNVLITKPWCIKYALLAYTTPSHKPEHHKFRLVFELPKSIQADEYSRIAKVFNVKIGADIACSNIDRMFFGNSNADIAIFNGKLTQSVIDSEMKATSEIQKVRREYEASGTNGSFSPATISDMLSAIPPDVEYTEWFGIVSGVGNYLAHDLDTAESLINSWAADDQRGTMWRLKNRGNQFTIATLIYHAKKHGYDTSKLYKNQRSNISVGDDGKLAGAVKSRGKSNKSDKVTVANIQDYLLEYYEFRFNIIKSHVEYRKKSSRNPFEQITDRIENTIWSKMRNDGLDVVATDLSKVLMSEFVKDFHPFKDYFHNLPDWDGADHIDQFMNCIVVESGQEGQWRLYFVRWLIATVATAIEMQRDDGKGRAVNHTCIVLVGKQGVGKTNIILSLAPEQLKQYMATTQINPNDKDSKVLASEKFIINLDELESSTREEIASLKSLMTSQDVSLRKPYARHAEVYPRRASFIGSVNKAMFLTDITGSRRFLTVDVVGIDDKMHHDIDQLYAQALSLLRSGAKYWFDGGEIDEIDERNKKYQVVSAEEELLKKYFSPYDTEDMSPADVRNMMNAGLVKGLQASEIASLIQDKTQIRLSYQKLAQILKNLGYVRQHIKFGSSTRAVYCMKENEASENVDF